VIKEGPTMKHTFRNRLGELVEIPEISATRAKNAFGELLDSVAAAGAVAITRHDAPRAVLISFEEFESLSSARSETLGALSNKFEGLLDRMQTPAARKGMAAAFNADPAALGQAAAEAVRRRR
jgi:antitoxin Phd